MCNQIYPSVLTVGNYSYRCIGVFKAGTWQERADFEHYRSPPIRKISYSKCLSERSLGTNLLKNCIPYKIHNKEGGKETRTAWK